MNPNKGEIELKAGDKIYVLRYSIDAICSLEEKTGKSFPTLAAEMGDPNKFTVTLVRSMLHAGLADAQPDITLKEAGEIIIAAGGMVDVMNKVGEALQAAFPDAEASGTPRPRNRADRRKVGTGPAS